MKIIKLLSLVIVFASISSCLEKDVLYKVEGDDPNEVPPTHILKKFQINYTETSFAYSEFDTMGYSVIDYSYSEEDDGSIMENSATFNRVEDLINQIQISQVSSPASSADYTATYNFVNNSEGQVQLATYTENENVQTLELSYLGNTVTGIHKVNDVQVGLITYVYDSDGKLLTRKIVDENNNNTYLATFTYSGNNVINIKYTDNFGEYYNSNFTYDDKVNPLYNQSFVDLQERLINDLFYFYSTFFDEYSTPLDGSKIYYFGSENNILTNSSDGSTWVYTYDADNYPTSAIETYAVSNSTFNYTYTYY